MASLSGVVPSTPAQYQSEAGFSLQPLLRLRTIVGGLLFCATLLFTFGSSWDITSHKTVGRDATFTPAHVTMLTALTITGLAAMILVLIETGWARRHPGVRDYGIPFSGGFTGPMGAYLAGFGAVASAVAFPLDNYWHSLYGIDTTLWAPFHVMIFLGAALSTLGVTYLFISIAHLAAAQHSRTLMRLCTGGAVIMLADLAQKLVGIVDPALTAQGLISLPLASFDLYPVMITASLMIGFSAAIFAFPRLRGAATLVLLIRTGINAILGVVIPPVMAWQIQFEHETLLPRATQAAARGASRSNVLMFVFVLVLALALDGIAWYARRKGWTLRTLLRTIFLAALPVLLVISLVGLATVQGQGSRHRLSALHLGGLSSLGLVTVLLSIVLVPVGELVGQWLGKTIGQSLKTEER